MSGRTGQGIGDGTVDHLPPGWKKGLAGAQCVQSLEEAAVLMDELRGLPEFLFGYVAPGAKPKVIVFLDAEIYGDKRPKGMVPMLIPARRLGSNQGLTGVTGGSSVKRLLDREGARRREPVDSGNAVHPLGQVPRGVRCLIAS